MNEEIKQKIHYGVYGLFFKDDKILVIKKGRGPYKGKYDLPGGKVEFGETTEEALKREFREEVGGEILECEFLTQKENIFKYLNEEGEEKTFHHIGNYYLVKSCKIENLKLDADGHDSLGAEFLDVNVLNDLNCATIVLNVISNYK